MRTIKSYLAEMLLNKRVHFKCDCAINLDVTGKVIGWRLHDNEILWDVQLDGGRIIKIGENHPNLNLELLN